MLPLQVYGTVFHPPARIPSLKLGHRGQVLQLLVWSKFTIRTDNDPLTYITSAKLNDTGHRWLSTLATYDFNIQYHA